VRAVLEASQIGRLIQALNRQGYDVIGSTVRDEAIVYDHIESAEELPWGWSDEQELGWYRLKYSAIPSGRIAGRNIFIRRSSGFGSLNVRGAHFGF